MLNDNMDNYAFIPENKTMTDDNHTGLCCVHNMPVNESPAVVDNMSLLLQYNDDQLVYQLPAIVYTGLMMLIGLPGNMIVFYVYFFKWRRSTSRMFILYLAGLDMVNCFTTIPMEIVIMRYSVALDLPYLCKWTRFMTYVLNSSSALILVGIAVDRFKRICKPYQKTFSERTSKYICVSSIIFSIACTWPMLIFYGTRMINLGPIQGKACLLQNAYDKTIYPFIFFAMTGFLTLVIFAALSVLYMFVGVQIYKHRQFKLKKCSHVQKIVDEKSYTVKSDTVKVSNERSKHSSKELETLMANGNLVNMNGIGIVITEEPNEMTYTPQYNIEAPEASHDPGTDCGMLDIRCHSARDLSTDRSLIEFSTKDVSVCTTHTHDGAEVEGFANLSREKVPVVKVVTPPKPSPKKKIRRRERKVRYLLVRGSSTMNSGRTKCSNCLTVRIGKSTLMLFLITIAYFVSNLPFYVIAFLRLQDEQFVEKVSSNTSEFMAYNVFLRSYLLSSAINPIIYSFCNFQFREHCFEAFRRMCGREVQLQGRRRFRRT